MRACHHIKHRSIIESDLGTLKNNFQLEYHKARSIVGMFRHFFYSIVAYMINRKLKEDEGKNPREIIRLGSAENIKKGQTFESGQI